MAGKAIDPEAIRRDMLTVVNYMNQAMGIDYADMVLVVPPAHPGEEYWLFLFFFHRSESTCQGIYNIHGFCLC